MRQTVAVGVIKSVEKTEKGGKCKFSFHMAFPSDLIIPLLVTKSAEKATKKK